MGKNDESNVASLDPGEMLAGGLKDDFRGTVIEAGYARWDYDGNIDEPVLAARLVIKVEDEDEPFVQHWSAGSLDAWVPSMDGRTPADEDEIGPFAFRVGKRTQLNNNTNFAHLMSSILDAGEASKKFTRDQLTASLECLVGLDAHWNRVPQKKRSGLVDKEEGERKRANDVLVVTEVFGYGEEAKKGKKTTKVTAAKPAAKKEDEDEEETGEVSPLDEKLQGIVTEALAESDGKMKKGKLPPLILSKLAKDKDKAAGVKRAMEAEFLQGGPWDYDAASGVLSFG
jgi:hypothetical protein